MNHEQLSAAFANAGFLLYPTRYPETGCVTVMRAMALGAIPITSSYFRSVIPSLTRDFDLGPGTALDDLTAKNDEAYTKWVAEVWGPSVVIASLLDAVALQARRNRMIQYARSHFLWEHSAKILSELISENISKE